MGAMLAGQACEACLASAESAMPAAYCLLWRFNHGAVVTPPTSLPVALAASHLIPCHVSVAVAYHHHVCGYRRASVATPRQDDAEVKAAVTALLSLHSV